jgi:hypothetical protein
VNRYLAKAAGRLAPRTMTNIATLNTLDKQYEDGPARFVSYERELRTLRREMDELRRDNRRVAELYDIVFEWAKTHAAEGDDVFDGELPTSARHARPVDFDDSALAASTVDEADALASDGESAPDAEPSDEADQAELDDDGDVLVGLDATESDRNG